MPARRDRIRQGVSITIVLILCLSCFVMGWALHSGLSNYFDRNVTGIGMIFELGKGFNSPQAFISMFIAIGTFGLTIYKTFSTKRRND